MKNYFSFIFAIVFFLSSSTWASFDENARRYLSGEEIIWSLSVFFDFSQNTEDMNANICMKVDSRNSTILGVNSPNSGEPISPGPTQALVLWITNCIQGYFSHPAVVAGGIITLKNLVGEDIFNHLYLSHGGVEKGLAQPWSSWTLSYKTMLINYMVEAFLGSDSVIKDFGFIQNPDEFRALLLKSADSRPNATVLDILYFLSVNLATRDEFLSY
jgi:hypothetical protein